MTPHLMTLQMLNDITGTLILSTLMNARHNHQC